MLDDLKGKKTVYYRLMPYDDLFQSVCFKIEALYGKKLIEKNSEFIFSGCYLDRDDNSEEYPKFNKMIHDVENGYIDVIILRKISDFPGTVRDFLSFVSKIQESDHPVRIISISESFDTEKFKDNFFTLCCFVFTAYSEKEAHYG